MWFFQINASAKIARWRARVQAAVVRYLLLCCSCAFESHETMWAFPLRPHSLTNGSAALLMGFATGVKAMVRERLTIHMCRHGLRLSVVVVYHVPHSDQCNGDNCASECTGEYCGRA
jgi:cytochrome c oxidase assembly factor CtaG